jgi:hypothetical protein
MRGHTTVRVPAKGEMVRYREQNRENRFFLIDSAKIALVRQGGNSKEKRGNVWGKKQY